MFLCQQYSSGSGPFSQNSPLPLPPSLVVVLVVVAVVVVALFVVVKARVVVVLVRLVVIFVVVPIVVVGQMVVLQRLRLLRPTHLRPPFCALFLTLLVEVWRPPPQVFVHDAHLPHCPHWQSTERRKAWILLTNLLGVKFTPITY